MEDSDSLTAKQIGRMEREGMKFLEGIGQFEKDTDPEEDEDESEGSYSSDGFTPSTSKRTQERCERRNLVKNKSVCISITCVKI